ncbi:MAG: DUF4136 domain-containing protein [Ignavibacteria bacterium]|nr:DUF4136 domain-containing protein [Ignavibacteria bacterium]MBT8390756.1 DUF4136 domain-containing protein [Ignavibacteria bacterium]
MKLKLAIISTLLILVFVGCSSLKVATDFDPSQDFSKYNTYRWATTNEINPNDALAQNPLVEKRVVAGIDKALQDKGFVLAGDDVEPDFVVMTHAGLKEKMNVTQTGGYRGYGWYDPWWGPYGGHTQVSYYEEGSLVIDIVDWTEKELSWRGVGTGIVKEGPADKDEAQEEINLIVAKILTDFPPGSESK